jgi:hypothetical protein
MRWLRSWITGGADELGWDDLVRRVSKAIAETAQYGARGAVSFPPEVDVRIIVEAGGPLEVAREFLQRPAFDREVATQLENRCNCAAALLPLRNYEVKDGPQLQVRAVARAAGSESRWVVRLEGGDLDGQVFELPAGRPEVRFGRGPWHGGDRQVANDLILPDECAYVSRRAGRLVVSGHLLEIESLDQGDLLFVRRADGESLRPARAASGRASLREGDAIELSDGAEQAIRLCLQRRRSGDGSA